MKKKNKYLKSKCFQITYIEDVCRGVRICLQDIEQSISEIWSFLPEQRNFFEFQKDLKARKAVERNIEIIGEAMNRTK
ncbi:hypothetical protein FACS189430_08770 [Bacteroidia bacterium]|nr:hypothetical protein FACS189430_08770 [Bacteroidia bacterium]